MPSIFEQTLSALEETAVHEAGHCVIAWVLGLTIVEASIVEDTETNGHVTIREEHGREFAIFSLAGELSVARFSGRSTVLGDGTKHSDYGHLKKSLDAMIQGPSYNYAHPLQARHMAHGDCLSEARKLVNANVRKIQSLANRLLEKKTMTGDEIDRFLGELP